jgi:TRAP-type mannitol/chloroaromatic compound transport system substrate-binding protein
MGEGDRPARAGRRAFLAGAVSGTSAATLSLASPALAQRRARVSWRCASGFPDTLETLHGMAGFFADSVREATDGTFDITVVPTQETPTGPAALEALRDGSFDMLHTASHYFSDVDPAFAFGSGMPFGLNQRLTDAWLHAGGGLDLLNAFYADHNVIAFPAGNTGAQMGGWFNKEINSLADLRGTRLRIGGFGGRIIERIGVLPQAMLPGDIVAGFESQSIDAAEFAGPADDLALGLNRVARYLYYPGWWEGGVALMNMINRERYDALSAPHKAVVAQASALANVTLMARYDMLNPPALRQIEASGTVIRPYTNDILDACFLAAEQTYAAIASTNAPFARLLSSYMSYRREGNYWFRRSEYPYDTFLMILERGGRL